ncbi:LacI family DNA-binding transcriptional regulator [Radicibacter daui]|uniref:LacI family DNA-binding transcriptional regulator n=1 Tax=Radicibacter daui TaxID=3064829 RepID=UPI004046B0BB
MVGKPSSINDVAKLAGVSPATVSNVLTGRKAVSAELARKVEAAVKELDYRADPLASMLRSGDAKIIAILVPDLDNPFFTSVVSAVEQCVGKESYEVIVASSRGDQSIESSKLRAMLAWRPAGLIIVPCSDEFPGHSLIDASNTPYVIADRVTGSSNADTVSLDNEAAGRVTAEHLIALGHRHILIAATSLTLANIRQRCNGARAACMAHGLPEPKIVELGIDGGGEPGKLIAVLGGANPPTAIQALTNGTTLAALTALAERGLRLPQDISLIGFDDYTWMRARATPLTAVAQPVREMGRLLWERLNARIKGDASPAQHVRLPCDFKIRQSTAAPSGTLSERRPVA